MSDNYPQDEIDAYYGHIVDRVRGNTLYGLPIVIVDAKMMVVAAYLLGKDELRRNHMNERRSACPSIQ